MQLFINGTYSGREASAAFSGLHKEQHMWKRHCNRTGALGWHLNKRPHVSSTLLAIDFFLLKLKLLITVYITSSYPFHFGTTFHHHLATDQSLNAAFGSDSWFEVPGARMPETWAVKRPFRMFYAIFKNNIISMLPRPSRRAAAGLGSLCRIRVGLNTRNPQIFRL